MLTISQTDIQQSGGLLAALSEKSCEYLRRILPTGAVPSFGGKVAPLERLIVHTSPHLDEYFAELLFRSCLPREKQGCVFIEQSIFSKTNDLNCQKLWPDAAVFGIGRTVSGGVLPLFLFDEHVSGDDSGGRNRTAASCSQLVVDKSFQQLPDSISMLLKEVNAIDEFGKAHEQNLANLIKVLHEVRFVFEVDVNSGRLVTDTLTPEWKRAIIDASITAVIYCLEEKIDLVGHPAEKKASLVSSLEKYAQHSPHRSHGKFDQSLQFLRSTFGDQGKVFADAVLRNRKGPITDAIGNTIPQLLTFSRFCFACERCWGENIRDIIATHFWEVAMQGQLNFYPVEEAVSELFARNFHRLVSPVGHLRKEILPPINVGRAQKAPVWIISISPDSSVFLPNKGAMNFINENNSIGRDNNGRPMGCGLVLVLDTFRGTSVLMRGSGIPETKWERLVKLIKEKEGDYWHVTPNSSGGIAPFIVNGNRAHQYVPRTGMDIKTLSRLVQRTFY